MILLIPMAGAGQRFASAGYELHKPVIPVRSRRSGKQIPMVIAAVQDMPSAERTVFVDRDFHKQSGMQEEIKKYYPRAEFITINYLTQGQAASCLIAKDIINTDEELIIGTCDNGLEFNHDDFAAAKDGYDAMVFTFRNNAAVEEKPEGYGWVKVEGDHDIKEVSVKVPISGSPVKDHAIVGAFWFRRGKDFVRAAEAMIAAGDKINGEFYADQVINYIIKMGLRARVFEVERYFCWGTPREYESYENTMNYWSEFYKNDNFLMKSNREL